MYSSNYILAISILCQYCVATYAQVSNRFFRADYKYYESTESFYKIHTISKPWQGAKETCEMEGATLFYPKDLDEAYLVKIFLIETQPQYSKVSVGASTTNKLNYKTIEGIPVENLYNIWEAGKPSNGSEDCLYFTRDSKIGNWDCSTKRPFICKKSLSTLQWNEQCDMPYTDYVYNEALGGCYKFHPSYLTWKDAYAVCRAENSHLAVINSEGEAEFLANITANAPTASVTSNRRFVHLGFLKKSNKGWFTIAGVPLSNSGFSKWRVGEPNNLLGAENCGSMDYNGKLNDIACESKNGMSAEVYFICEHEIQKQNTEQHDTFDDDADEKVAQNIFRSDYRYFEDTQSFYKIHTVAKTWKEAEQVCAAEGSVLFFPHDGKEIDVAKNFLRETQPTIASIFVGASAASAEGYYDTIEGVPVENLVPSWGWKEGEPNSGSSDDCLYMTKEGRLGDSACSTKQPFVCKKTLASLPWNNEPCKMVDTGYVYNENLGGCYKFHINRISWVDAAAACIAEHSHLAVINSQAEADYLATITAAANKPQVSTYNERVHLGFQKKGGKWVTVTGVSLDASGYNTWNAGEPNNAGGPENCGQMYYNGKFNDIACGNERIAFFICEHEVFKHNI